MNEQITAEKIFLIDVGGQVLGQMSREQAFFLASDSGLDLVQVGVKNDGTAIVKMLDFQKERYAQEKQAKRQRSKQNRGNEIKEIKLSFRIEEHDFQTKIKRAQQFLERGYKIKVFIKLVGRENMYAGTAVEKIERFAKALGLPIEKIDRRGSYISAILTK